LKKTTNNVKKSVDVMSSYINDVNTFKIMNRGQQDEFLKNISYLENKVVDKIVSSIPIEHELATLLLENCAHNDNYSDAKFGFIGSESKKTNKDGIKFIRLTDSGRRWLDKSIHLGKDIFGTKKHNNILVQLKEIKTLKDKFVSSNLKLTISLAGKISKYSKFMSISDLIQEGNIGLMKAIDRFDNEKGFSFSTYACWWIRHHMKRSIDEKEKTVRMPVHLHDLHYKINKFETNYKLLYGKDPSDVEVADGINEQFKKVERAMFSRVMTEAALDAPIMEDGGTLHDILEMSEPVLYDENIEKKRIYDEINQALLMLTPTESYMIRKRFGLDGNEPKTLNEISIPFEITRERVRQIEAGAMRKLRRVFKNSA